MLTWPTKDLNRFAASDCLFAILLRASGLLAPRAFAFGSLGGYGYG
jgi:hypothetical protein